MLIRVPASEVVVGDRMGDGRWQGVQIVEVLKYPRLQDATTYHLSLGSHGWIDLGRNAMVLVEREQNRECPRCGYFLEPNHKTYCRRVYDEDDLGTAPGR